MERKGPGDERRRSWVVPAAKGVLGEVDLGCLDPARADDRYFLILAEHPELQHAIEQGVEEVEVGGVRLNPRLHLAVHELVAGQLWEGDPPEVWTTALRLRELGYERHHILHMLGSAALEQLWEMACEGRPYDRRRYVAALAGLPESWERLRPAAPRLRSGRRGVHRRGWPRRAPGSPGIPEEPRSAG